MRRVQVYLSAEDVQYLDRVARVEGTSRSELIRRAIRRPLTGVTPVARSPEERRAAIRASAGIWQDRKFTTEEYMDAVRGRGGKSLADLDLS